MIGMALEGLKYILFHSRIKDNEECPCGSGKLFVDCCKNRSPVISSSKEPPEVQLMKRMRSSMKKCCMHPDKSRCNGRIKKAHALQNNKIVSLLAGTERHVFMLDAKRQPLLVPLETGEIVTTIEVSKTSANDATIETCFCDYHDNIAFAAIEKEAPDFDINNDEMKFVYAYKAFIFEAYKEEMSYSVFQNCFRENPAAFQSKEMVLMYRMLQLKHREFVPVRNHYDAQIMAGSYNGIYTCTVRIPEQIQFADFAFIAPDFDMNGKSIHHTMKGIMHRISLTIFPEATQSWLLVSCLDDEFHIYRNLFDQLSSASLDKLKFYLNMLLPLYSENMVLGYNLWSGWDDEMRNAYTYYANLNGPDAKRMGMVVQMGLKNAGKRNNEKAYQNNPKINLFP